VTVASTPPATLPAKSDTRGCTLACLVFCCFDMLDCGTTAKGVAVACILIELLMFIKLWFGVWDVDLSIYLESLHIETRTKCYDLSYLFFEPLTVCDRPNG
jgi:hypothetical protein